jgi:hypothetical protein
MCYTRLFYLPIGPVISAGLCMSPCSSDYTFTCTLSCVLRVVSEEPAMIAHGGFLRIVSMSYGLLLKLALKYRKLWESFPHIARFY